MAAAGVGGVCEIGVTPWGWSSGPNNGVGSARQPVQAKKPAPLPIAGGRATLVGDVYIADGTSEAMTNAAIRSRRLVRLGASKSWEAVQQVRSEEIVVGAVGRRVFGVRLEKPGTTELHLVLRNEYSDADPVDEYRITAAVEARRETFTIDQAGKSTLGMKMARSKLCMSSRLVPLPNYLGLSGLHQINGQTDVNTLLPPPRSHPACIYVDALVPEMSELVRPKAVPGTLGRPARHTGVEANLAQGAPRNSGNESTGKPLHVIAGPCIRRRCTQSSRCPSALREVEEVLAVDQHDGAHNKKHPPGDGSKRSVQRAGK